MKSIGNGRRSGNDSMRKLHAAVLFGIALFSGDGLLGQSPAAAPAQGADSVIFEKRLALARAQRLDTLPIGKIVVAVGKTFVGSPYVPHTLEPPGPERLVVDLREFDCVTFVENML